MEKENLEQMEWERKSRFDKINLIKEREWKRNEDGWEQVLDEEKRKRKREINVE